MSFKIHEKFDLCVAEICKDKEDGVLKFISRHPRRQVVLDNLCRELRTYDLKFPTRYKRDHEKNKRRVNEMVASIASLFVNTALEEHRQKTLTDAEKSLLTKGQTAAEDAKQIMTEVKPSAKPGRQAGETELIFQ